VRLEGHPSSLSNLSNVRGRWHRRLVFVYIPRCADGSYYIGHTADLATRERTHNEGHGAPFTPARRPVVAVYAEQWPSEAAAIHRERPLKRWSAAKKKALIAGQAQRSRNLPGDALEERKSDPLTS
jgi:predicted GIY-YIG superfamily endonuclease